jgi:hypothetical protein
MHRPFLVTLMIAVALFLGCNDSKSNPEDLSHNTPIVDEHAAHGDEHEGHDHSHDSTGMHGGHILELGDEQYHIEWLHDDDTGVITIYVLSSDMRVIEGDAVSIRTQVASGKPKQFAFTKSELGGQSMFELSNAGVITALKMVGEDVSAQVTVKVGDEEFTQKFEEHSHGHDH